MQAAKADTVGLYISFPFCRSKCTYCNFASGVYPASEHDRYMSRLVKDIESAGAWAESVGVELPKVVDTIYLGGGTPSLLEPELIHRLFGAIEAAFHVKGNAEITMECAPGQLQDATLFAMTEVGVNRVSLGVQSFIDKEASASGRLHKRSDVLNDLKRLCSKRITNLNVDLIAGLSGQSLSSWDESLAVLIDSGVTHASIYMLEVDEDSRLGRELLARGHRYHADLVPTDETIVRMYETAQERLTDAGLQQYEISNFARPGAASRHNLRYWERRPYLGLGLDASSALMAKTGSGASEDKKLIRPLLRCKTTDDLRSYLDGPKHVETEWLSASDQFEEAWFLGLRMNCGVDLQTLRFEFGSERVKSALESVTKLDANGLVRKAGETVTLTARGRLLSNEVFQEFLMERDPCGTGAD